MQERDELDAWLGDVKVTAEQRAALHRASEMVHARYPERDLADDREAAFSTAAMLILGDATLATITDAYVTARRAERAAMASLTGAIIAASADQAETAMSRETGLNRMTIRKALGK
ncbi:hypothetical protein J2Y69_003050 [Microbacterium resistens]|uniref:Helix-turn-helix DNA binding domain protein n=1 Tax=Microbacterium resistens TaxID=156977 RepID=A0ABU1SFR2_9MICO|nr:hypothetical protein [Microbacterium resistens]MDR6868434.1 hypothetical protein [Microbacterium resistens]